MKKLHLILFIFVLTTQITKAQNLVQSFIESNSVGNSRFGNSVSSAGDVNGDGYDDVIVGAPWSPYSSYLVGRAYIYYGGSIMDNVADITIIGEIYDYFGISVSGVGDVNGDGYDDVIVGGYGHLGFIGRSNIYLGGSNMNNEADVFLNGEASDNCLGISVSGAGDVNGDGYDDVIVGADGYSTKTGRSYIYFGGSLMNNVADVIMTGEASDNYFGHSVSRVGDVNGDGYDDIIVGAYGYSTNTGRSYIYFGGSSMNNVADVIMTGEGIGDKFGIAVSNAGDVNNDDYDDVIVGAYGYSTNTGRSYIYFGGSSMNNVAGVIMTGEGIGDKFGISVSGAGDVNNDGYADVIVGASDYSSYTGRYYIYLGGGSMNNVADITMIGEGSNNYFGCSVSDAGDINNDGYGDIIVGASGYDSYSGRSYILLGGSNMDNITDVTITEEANGNFFGYSISDAGDVNDDGYDDIIIGAPSFLYATGRCYVYFGGSSMDNVADVTMTGEASENYFGNSVSGAGDVNNDGYGDVIVGAPGHSSSIGCCYIFFGGSSMDNVADVTMAGLESNNYFGRSVSCAGDVNNDGYNDVIVGAYGYSSATGRCYIYFGGSSMNTIADVTISGEESDNYFGYSVSGAGDLNDDGYDDVVVGAYGYSSGTGRCYIYFGGSSMDTIADVTISGETGLNFFGYSVSGAGDVNGDINGDIIVGAYGFSSFTGRCYIYFGGSNMDNVADVTISGEASINYFGYSVSAAGDLNDDSYEDVIVGAMGYSSFTGRSYIYYGGSSMDNVADVSMTGEGSNNNFGCSVSSAGDINGDGYPEIIIGATGYPTNGKAYLYNFKPVVQENFTLNDSTLAFGDIACYNALQNITVSEIPAVILLDGSTATFIAGNSIRFMPGFYAESGSVMNAYITTDATFCDVVVPKSVSDLSLVAEVQQKPSDLKKGAGDIKLYPNPNSGSFTLELTNFGPQATVAIYNLLGEKIASYNQPAETLQPINLEGIRKGIYFVEVADGKTKLMKKMIINE